MKRLLCALLLLPGLALAGAADIRVSGAWARAMPPVMRTTAGYLVIENRGSKDDVLLGACIDGIDTAEVHEMSGNGDSMVMRRRETLAVPARGRIEFVPGGLHLMLIDAEKPLQAGSRLSGTLHFRDAGDVRVVFEIRAP